MSFLLQVSFANLTLHKLSEAELTITGSRYRVMKIKEYFVFIGGVI